MNRFYCPHIQFEHLQTFQITDNNELHHLKNVLRLKPHQQIIVFNGEGKAATATILEVTKNSATVRIEKIHADVSQSRISIVLACAIPKKAKFETIIEKCTELNITEIVPLKTERTIFTIKDT